MLDKTPGKPGERNPKRVLESAVVVGLICTFLPFVANSQELDDQSLAWYTQGTLNHLGVILKMYAQDDDKERFPPRAQGMWTPDLHCLYPKLMNKPSLVFSPRLHGDERAELLEKVGERSRENPPDLAALQSLMAEDFIYTGYALMDAVAIRAFTAALREAPAPDLHEDIKTGDTIFYRLRAGIERFFITMAEAEDPTRPNYMPSRLPVMVENAFTRDMCNGPRGAYVLYMDGRVDYVTVEEEPEFFAALEALVRGRPAVGGEEN
jgi:hypothetical protein